jgi:PAS domain S-box-containing protein
MEEALRKNEERLQAILDNTTAFVYLKDTEGRYMLVNPRVEALFRMTKEQILGKTDYDLFPKETADVLRVNDRRVLETRAPVNSKRLLITIMGCAPIFRSRFLCWT